MDLQDLAHRLQKPKFRKIRGRNGLVACCPAHEDKSPSFSAWEGEDGWLHVKCHVGCSEQQIIQALGWQPDDRKYLNGTAWTEPATYYTYRDEDGKYLFEKVRKRGPDGRKTFIQQIHNAKTGEIIYGVQSLGQQAKILYNYAQVKAAIGSGVTVYLNEGEKGAESFMSRGYVGTCAPTGAGKDQTESAAKWMSYNTGLLVGANVIIVADRDETGESHAKFVAAELSEAALSVRVVQSRTIGEKDDAYDHFQAGFSVDEFINRPDLLPPSTDSIRFLDTVDARAIDWVWEPYLLQGRPILLDAEGGVGKTSACISLIACLSMGHRPGSLENFRPLKCLILGSEDDAEDTILPRLVEFGGDPRMVAVDSTPIALDEAGIAKLARRIRKHKFDFLLIDPLFDYLPAQFNTNAAFDTADFMSKMNAFYLDTGVSGVHIRHFVRPTKDRKSKDMGMGSVMWRNKHRLQLTMQTHPDDEAIRVIRQDKNNLGPRARNFGFRWAKGVPFEWLFNHPLLDNIGEEKAVITERAERFLESLLRERQYWPVNEILQRATQGEHLNWGVVQKARVIMGLEVFKREDRTVWGFSAYNPFETG